MYNSHLSSNITCTDFSKFCNLLIYFGKSIEYEISTNLAIVSALFNFFNLFDPANFILS